MEVIIKPDAQQGSLLAARIIARLVRERPSPVLGLATGASPIAVYRELVRMHREEGLDFSRVTTFNLDEHVGLPHDHPLGYHRFMAEHLFDHVNVAPERIHIPDGMAHDVLLECQEFEAAIVHAGGIDLQLLGIGVDGHIGFNEPTSSLSSRTRIKTITPETAAGYLSSMPPDRRSLHVLTMGVGTILEARRCLMLAFGQKKAQAVARMIEGPVSAMVPASALQLHENTTVILDEAAASELRLRDYYRSVYQNKPEWQREE